MIERRQPFIIDEAKFSTQRVVTYALLIIFTGVTIAVFWQNDQAERSTIMQTVINFTMLAIGFWLGSSKGAIDKAETMSRLAAASVPTMAGETLKANDVKIDAQTATVTEAPQPPKGATP